MKKNIFRIVVCIILIAITFSSQVFAAPSTGLAKLDEGGWKLVGIFQSAIFWLSMLYTFRCLLEVTVRGEGSWKKVGTGFLICVFDYLIPFLFNVIKQSFS